jgi:hypothetical protein
VNINDWVVRTELESPITEHALLLLGRNGVTNNPIGSAVFIAAGLALTAKHVVAEFWRLYGARDVRLEQKGDKTAHFEIIAIQYPGEQSDAAIWMTRMIWLCPYSDIAAISLAPVDDLSRGYQFAKLPMLSVLPPTKGENVTAFGYAASSVLGEEGTQIKLALNPLSAPGVVTEVYPEYRDRGLLSFPSFQIKTHYIGGMSGGPIYNEAGELCGLVCAGQDAAPVAYGVALWPMLGVTITHQGEGTICKGPYPIFELATVGHLHLRDWDKITGNVEFIEEPFGQKRIRLKSAK